MMRMEQVLQAESTPHRLVFLDFDGVLHPAAGGPADAPPFCWVAELAEELAPHPDVGIVVHSSWIDQHSVEDVREFLGPLGLRLLGTVGTGEKSLAVLSFVRSLPDLHHWIVIDDDATRFESGFRRALSQPDRARIRPVSARQSASPTAAPEYCRRADYGSSS